MSTKHDGGPAFPCGNAAHPDNPHEGMTLRDWFAGQAIAGVLERIGDADEVSARCYRIADAMLARRAL